MRRKIKITIKNDDLIKKYSLSSIYNDNKYFYVEKDTKVELEIVSKNNVILHRYNDEFDYIFNFNLNRESILDYKLLKQNANFKINFNTKNIFLDKLKLVIEYNLENQDFKYTLENEEDI